MSLREALEEARKKAEEHGLRITCSHFSRQPFAPGTPQHVIKAYEEAERAQLLINVVEKRAAKGKPIDLASVMSEVNVLQQALRLGATISIS